MGDLKPCPFSGIPGKLMVGMFSGRKHCTVRCDDGTDEQDCFCHGSRSYDTEAEAIAAWNRRQTAAVPNIHEAVNSLVRQCENSHECWEAGRTDCFCVSTAATILAALPKEHKDG